MALTCKSTYLGVDNIWGNVGKEAGTFSHEFAHARSKYTLINALFAIFVAPHMKYKPDGGYFDHAQYGVLSRSGDKSTNYENANGFKKGSKGVNIRQLKRKLKK